jgi:D-sedoheptulose 7-phosphate isomerase
MLEQKVQQHFFESADLQYQVAEVLARPVTGAAQALVDGITSGGRVFCCGLGLSSLDARYMSALLLGRFEQDRPALAAFALGQDGGDTASTLTRQVQALGHPGDMLLLFDAHQAHDSSLRELLLAAHAQDMTVIALTGQSDDELRSQLIDTDVHIRVPHGRAARVSEIHRLLSHCLCDAVDLQLLGAGE